MENEVGTVEFFYYSEDSGADRCVLIEFEQETKAKAVVTLFETPLRLNQAIDGIHEKRLLYQRCCFGENSVPKGKKPWSPNP